MYDSNRYRRQTRNPGVHSSSTSVLSSPTRMLQRPFQSDVGKIIIKNLDKEIDNKALQDTFSAFGNIWSCKVVQDGRGNSKGYAFVHFKTEKAAKMSIERANGMLLKTRKIYVAQYIPRKEREEKDLGEKAKLFTNVYVKNFGEELNDDKLKEMFDSFGIITNHKVITKDDGKSSGFAFVTFENCESAQLAVLCLNGKIINGKSLSVENKVDSNMQRISFEELKKQNNLLGFEICVKNLDDIIEDERLRKEFSPFGTINSAKVITDTDGRPKGFVCFNLAEEAVRAVNHMNGRMFGSKQLYVALAERKENQKFFGQQLTQIRTTPLWASLSGAAATKLPNMAAAAGQLHSGAAATAIRETHQNRAIAMSLAAQESVSNFKKIIENMRSSPGKEPLIASILANKTASDQKEILGERLLPIIERMHPILGGKITGMLLEIENYELLHMLEDSSALKAKVDEAVAVIKAHEAKQIFTKDE